MTELREIVAVVFLLSGAVFAALGAIALIRLPDAYSRSSGSVKTGLGGFALILIGCVILRPELELALRSIVMVLALAATLPMGSHILTRFAYRDGDKLAPGTKRDDLARDEVFTEKK